jgi:N-acetylglucosaminyl-diphospho-decaprenol L-rhamnosyltransferase
VTELDLDVDAVVVAYNSARTLRGCVERLAATPGARVWVVDNASPDDALATIADLPATVVRAGRNGGFAAGCNLGVARGTARHVLLLNPDARIEPSDLRALADALDSDPELGLVAPRILEQDGSLAYSQRRFPRLRSTFAQALFLHRLRPYARWSDELIRDPALYERAGDPEWVSGACMLIRRAAIEQVGGLDEDFFLYCEDIDLCARLRAAGWGVAYEPAATARHEGGASRAREELLAVYARNRVLYAQKHASRRAVLFEALGVALGHATHAMTAIAHPAVLRGHLRALAAALRQATRPAEAH